MEEEEETMAEGKHRLRQLLMLLRWTRLRVHRHHRRSALEDMEEEETMAEEKHRLH